MSGRNGQVHVRVDPAPSDEELAAIAAVVVQLARRTVPEGEEDSPSLTQGRDRWARAGRREALRSVEWERNR